MMRKIAVASRCTVYCAWALTLVSNLAQAADAPKTPPAANSPTPSAASPQKIDVDALKQKYWAKGNERDLEVVQNRIYTKKHKLTLEFDYGSLGGDPFINTSGFGGQLGFYFNEYIGLDVLYMNLSSSHSTAYDALVTAVGNGANSNNVTSLFGGELTASLLYGKLSLVGKAILHFDLMARAGIGKLSLSGSQSLQTQSPLAPWIGVGQQLYVTRWLSLHLDYRMLFYSQNIVEQFQPDTRNTVIATTSVRASMITGGISLLLF